MDGPKRTANTMPTISARTPHTIPATARLEFVAPFARPLVIPTDQAWFFTPQWLAGEREADAEIAVGRGNGA